LDVRIRFVSTPFFLVAFLSCFFSSFAKTFPLFLPPRTGLTCSCLNLLLSVSGHSIQFLILEWRIFGYLPPFPPWPLSLFQAPFWFQWHLRFSLNCIRICFSPEFLSTIPARFRHFGPFSALACLLSIDNLSSCVPHLFFLPPLTPANSLPPLVDSNLCPYRPLPLVSYWP